MTMQWGRTLLMLMVWGLTVLTAQAQDSVAVAADFTMETRQGDTVLLSELMAGGQTVAADHTLLMFYDPDCSDCRQELFAMRHSSALRQAVSEGRLRVVCVYAEQDEALWRDTCGELPEAWTVAVARSDVHASYDLSAMPLLLLLDKQRHVIQQGYEIQVLLRHFCHKI